MNVVKQLAQLPDATVIKRIVDGEVALFEILIRRYNPYLYKIGRSYGFRHADVEDLMQDTFVSTYLNLAKFEYRSSFKTWVVRIMLNNCYQRAQKFSYKKEKTGDEIMNEKKVPLFTSSHHTDTDKVTTNRELSRVIEEAIVTIPEEYRMVFTLREISGLNTAETADVLNISETNVKVRLNRAKKMLRAEVEKMYAPEDIFEFNLIHCDPMVERVMRKIGWINVV